MTIAVSTEVAKRSRVMEVTRGSKRAQWRTEYMGTRVEGVEDAPQAYLAEMDANTTVRPHFHQVDQYQIMLAGSGTLGRNPVPVIALHYVDHHTAYGPINAGPVGLSFFTVRARSDPGAIHLHKPGYQEHLKPSKKRYLLAENIATSIEPVMQYRSELAQETVFKEPYDASDGLAACVLRLGAGMKAAGPDPATTGGQFYLVINGSLRFQNEDYGLWSTVFLTALDAPLDVCAGPSGLETLVLNFPRAEPEA